PSRERRRETRASAPTVARSDARSCARWPMTLQTGRLRSHRGADRAKAVHRTDCGVCRLPGKTGRQAQWLDDWADPAPVSRESAEPTARRSQIQLDAVRGTA